MTCSPEQAFRHMYSGRGIATRAPFPPALFTSGVQRIPRCATYPMCAMHPIRHVSHAPCIPCVMHPMRHVSLAPCAFPLSALRPDRRGLAQPCPAALRDGAGRLRARGHLRPRPQVGEQHGLCSTPAPPPHIHRLHLSVPTATRPRRRFPADISRSSARLCADTSYAPPPLSAGTTCPTTWRGCSWPTASTPPGWGTSSMRTS